MFFHPITWILANVCVYVSAIFFFLICFIIFLLNHPWKNELKNKKQQNKRTKKKETTYVIIFYLKKKKEFFFWGSKTVCVDEVLNILEDCWQQRRYKMY